MLGRSLRNPQIINFFLLTSSLYLCSSYNTYNLLPFTEISFGFHQHHPCMLCSYPFKFSYVSFCHWLLLLCLLVFGNRIASVSSVPTHSNFFRALSIGRQRVSWCQNDPDFCSNPEKNPWGGSVCCFGKFCKDVMADRNHCGGCGHVCGYEFVCCDGKCVDVRNDPRHCGGCFEGCSSPGRCAYAMCDYG
ncbi:putative stigma-specific protein Stig1 [Helianthus anomalus]